MAHSYAIRTGETQELYSAFASTSGPWVSLIAGGPVFFVIARWIRRRARSAANLGDDLGLAALARRASLSPAHLQRVFKAAIGETPKAYVLRLRIERAAFCLLIHESTVSQVAADCGFRSAETFIRAFRRRFRTSPRAYRSAIRADVADEREERSSTSWNDGQHAVRCLVRESGWELGTMHRLPRPPINCDSMRRWWCLVHSRRPDRSVISWCPEAHTP